jgi:hypothetical protein
MPYLSLHTASASFNKTSPTYNADHACPIPAPLIVANNPSLVVFLNALANRIGQLYAGRGRLCNGIAGRTLETKITCAILFTKTIINEQRLNFFFFFGK